MIIANPKDYKLGYRKHYMAYRNFGMGNDNIKSRRLLLIYAVECGLKYELLRKWNVLNPAQIIQGQDDRRKEILKSHDIRSILKELGQIPDFHFPVMTTKRKETVDMRTYHQAYRYGVELSDMNKEKECEKELVRVAEWIAEGL